MTLPLPPLRRGGDAGRLGRAHAQRRPSPTRRLSWRASCARARAGGPGPLQLLLGPFVAPYRLEGGVSHTGVLAGGGAMLRVGRRLAAAPKVQVFGSLRVDAFANRVSVSLVGAEPSFASPARWPPAVGDRDRLGPGELMESRRPFFFVAPESGRRPGDAGARGRRPTRRTTGRWSEPRPAGDAAAFRELYRRHLAIVHARLTLMVGPGPERDDLIQQIFLDAYRALARFRGDARFGTFLHRIAINVACDHLERRRRSSARYAPLEEAQLDRLVAAGRVTGVAGECSARSWRRRSSTWRRSARRSGSRSCWSPSRGCRWTRRPSCSTPARRR